MTTNCGTCCSCTVNLLPLKMSVVLPDIYSIYCPETLFSCYYVFVSCSQTAGKGKAINTAEGKTTDASVSKPLCCQSYSTPKNQFHLACTCSIACSILYKYSRSHCYHQRLSDSLGGQDDRTFLQSKH